MKKINLLHVTSSLKVGGAEAVLCDLVKNLEKKDFLKDSKFDNINFDQTIIYFHEGPNIENIKRVGVKCYQVRGLFCILDPVFFIRLFLLIKKIKPDLVHSLLWSANISSRLVCLFLKIPNVSAYHNLICIYSWSKNFLDKITRRFSKFIIAITKDVKDSLLEKKASEIIEKDLDCKNISLKSRYKDFDQKIVVIKNGLDFENIFECNKKYGVSRESLGLRETDFVIGSVARFSKEKNLDFLIKSFAEIFSNKDCLEKNKIDFLEKAKLVLVGLGPEQENLINLVSQLGLDEKVVFVVGKKACLYYKIFDCYVQPSVKEGINLALLEACSFAIPAIAMNIDRRYEDFSSLPNILQLKEHKEQLLCLAILEIYNNLDRRRKLAQETRAFVLENYCINKTIEKYREVFVRASC